MMGWRTALRLGRVSNLPTVWSNVVAGLLLAGASPLTPSAALLMVALSLFYVAGMFLNDWCDRHIDARERPERPIPAGEVSARSVLWAAAGMFAAGFGGIAWAGHLAGGGAGGMVAALVLIGAILLYDLRHKGNRWAPWVMGVCRGLIYVTAGYSAAAEPGPLLIPAALLLTSYVAGITYTARGEAFNRVEGLWPLALLAAPMGLALYQAPGQALVLLAITVLVLWIGYTARLLRRPAVGRAVGELIAGVTLVDTLFIALVAPWPWVTVGIAGLLLTRRLQRHVPGT